MKPIGLNPSSGAVQAQPRFGTTMEIKGPISQQMKYYDKYEKSKPQQDAGQYDAALYDSDLMQIMDRFNSNPNILMAGIKGRAWAFNERILIKTTVQPGDSYRKVLEAEALGASIYPQALKNPAWFSMHDAVKTYGRKLLYEAADVILPFGTEVPKD